jgi:hypothetical protein
VDRRAARGMVMGKAADFVDQVVLRQPDLQWAAVS